MPHPPLAIQSDVETLLQKVFVGQPDPVIHDLLARGQALIENYCHRSFNEEIGISETLDGHQAGSLRLSKYPVTAVSSVRENSVRLTVDTDYIWYPNGILVRGGARWTASRQGVAVTYTAGYAKIPRDLADVCARLVARWYQAGAAYAGVPDSAAAVKRVDLDGSDSVTYRDTVIDVSHTGSLSDDDKMALAPYRRWVLV